MPNGSSKKEEDAVKRGLDKSLSRMTTKDHFISSLKVAIAAIPFVGGAFSSLISDYIPKSKEERLIRYLEDLSREIDKVKSRIDLSYVTTDEFAFMFEKTLKATMEAYQQEKIEAFKAVLVNGLVSPDMDSDQKEYFLDRLIGLTSLHMKILYFLNKPETFLKEIGAEYGGGRIWDFSSLLSQAFPQVDSNVLRSAFQDLYSQGFTNVDQSIFDESDATFGAKKGEGRLSDYGKEFIEFCSLE